MITFYVFQKLIGSPAPMCSLFVKVQVTLDERTPSEKGAKALFILQSHHRSSQPAPMTSHPVGAGIDRDVNWSSLYQSIVDRVNSSKLCMSGIGSYSGGHD